MPSTVVSAMHYNPEACVLRIVFVSGRVYDYQNVPAKVYAQMKRAKSKGTFLNKVIKERYTYRKVE